MALILSIETSTSVCSVAIHQEGRLTALVELHQENVHAKQLMLLLDQILEKTALKVGDFSAIAVSSGPGSYTGLRIGVSVAKGLAYAQDLPIIAVDTLEGLAKRVQTFMIGEGFIVPMLDARRMEVYASVFDHTLQKVEPLSPKVITDENPYLSYLDKGPVFFVGDGVEKLAVILKHPNAKLININPSAESVGQLAFEKFLKGEFEDIAYFEPNYLKDFRVISAKKNLLLS